MEYQEKFKTSKNPKIIEIIIQNKYKVLIYPKQRIFDLILLESEYDEKILIFNKSYTSYFLESGSQNGAMIIHVKDDVYYLITSLVFRLKYEYEIKELNFDNYIISIFSKTGLLTIVKDNHDNYFCVEIDSYFEKRTKELKIAKLLNDRKHRYVPCLEISDF